MSEPLSSAEQREELFREFHAQQLRLQTRRLEQIHTYVAVWFWLTIIGALMIVAISASAGSSSF